MTFSNSHHEIFEFTGDIPAELTRYQIPGSQASGLSNQYGKLLLQEIESPSCRVLQAVYHLGRKANFHIRDKDPFFFTCVALQHDKHLELEDLGTIHLR